MVNLTCCCGKVFLVKPYRVGQAKFCSRKCKGAYSDKPRMLGNKFAEGHSPWNKDLQGIRLSPKSEFKNGHKPWNKNKKGIVLSDKNWFEKGHKPTNKRPVGSKSIRLDKHNTLRNWIKFEEPNVWIPYYRYLWYKAGRTIPDGMVLHHVNLRSDDDRLENLELVTREEHPRIHSQWKTNNRQEGTSAII